MERELAKDLPLYVCDSTLFTVKRLKKDLADERKDRLPRQKERRVVGIRHELGEEGGQEAMPGTPHP